MNSSLGLDSCYNISSGKFQQHFDCTPWYLWRYKKTLVKIRFNESLQFTLVQSLSRVWLCDLMNSSTPGLPVNHQLPESTQTHVPSSRWCHPTISSSVVHFSSCPQSFAASGFFQWVSSLHQVAKVFEFQLQHQSFQWTPRTDLL